VDADDDAADVEPEASAVEHVAVVDAEAHAEALATDVVDEVGALELDAGAQQQGRPC
jgi:hypothetical protein